MAEDAAGTFVVSIAMWVPLKMWSKIVIFLKFDIFSKGGGWGGLVILSSP